MTLTSRYGWITGQGEPPPYLGMLGCAVSEWGEGRCVLLWTPGAGLANTAGFVQGGFIAAALDLASAIAAATTYEGSEKTASVRLDVEYFRPVTAGSGDRLRLEGAVVRAGGAWVSSDASLFDAQGRLLARARHLIAKSRPSDGKGG